MTRSKGSIRPLATGLIAGATYAYEIRRRRRQFAPAVKSGAFTHAHRELIAHELALKTVNYQLGRLTEILRRQDKESTRG